MTVRLIKKYLSLLLVLASGMLCGFQESDPEIDQKLIDQIEIKTFIVSRDQLADIFRTDEDPIQLTNGELTKKRDEGVDIYLVTKVKNHGDRDVSGILRIRPRGYWLGISHQIDLLDHRMASFKIYVIPFPENNITF